MYTEDSESELRCANIAHESVESELTQRQLMWTCSLCVKSLCDPCYMSQHSAYCSFCKTAK
jgi:hypothetical protein